MVYSYHGALVMKMKEILTHATVWMNLENIKLGKESKHKRVYVVLSHAYEMSRICNFIETVHYWSPGAGEQVRGEGLLHTGSLLG